MAGSLACNYHHKLLLHLHPSSRSLTSSPLFNFSPRKRAFSHTSLLTRLSTNHGIISTVEHSDGSFVFKFGDVSEIEQDVQNVESTDTAATTLSKEEEKDGGNGVELEGDSVESDGVKVEDEESVDSVAELEEVAEESTDSVEIEEENDLVLVAEVENSDDSGISKEHEIADSTVAAATADSAFELSEERGSSVENPRAAVELDDTEVVGEEVKVSSELEHADVEGEEEVIEVMELPVLLMEAEPILDEEVSEEVVDDAVCLESGLGSEEATPPIILQVDEDACSDDILKGPGLGPEEPGLPSPETNPVRFNNVEISTAIPSTSSTVASISVPTEVNGAGHPSISGLVDDARSDISGASVAGLEELGKSSTLDSAEISTPTLPVSSGAASLSLHSEVDEAAPPGIPQSDGDPSSSNVSEEAGPAAESTGAASAETSFVSVESSAVALSTSPLAAPLPHAVEFDDATFPTIAQSGDDLCSDISVGAGPGTSGASEENTHDSQSEKQVSAPLLSLSSASAALPHPLQALTGGEDSYFVSDNWFGVADGVGQWSFEGINKGLYAQEFIQNCEMLALKSHNGGLTNVKELLLRSAAMTQSTGSARVLIAHFFNQVLHVANIGDSGFVIIRNGTILNKSFPMVHEFNFPYAIGSGDNPLEIVEEYHVELEDGDVIVTATDGLFDNLYEQEICSLVSEAIKVGREIKDLAELAELLATKAQEVGRTASARTPFADAAQAAGHSGFNGGKLDHVTVIVSIVQRN